MISFHSQKPTGENRQHFIIKQSYDYMLACWRKNRHLYIEFSSKRLSNQVVNEIKALDTCFIFSYDGTTSVMKFKPSEILMLMKLVLLLYLLSPMSKSIIYWRLIKVGKLWLSSFHTFFSSYDKAGKNNVNFKIRT